MTAAGPDPLEGLGGDGSVVDGDDGVGGDAALAGVDEGSHRCRCLRSRVDADPIGLSELAPFVPTKTTLQK